MRGGLWVRRDEVLETGNDVGVIDPLRVELDALVVESQSKE